MSNRIRHQLTTLIDLLEPVTSLRPNDGPTVTYGIEWAMDVKQAVAQIRELLAQPQPTRLLRVLEYTGPDEWINEQINNRGVKGTHRIIGRGGTIREALIGETPELLAYFEATDEEESIG